MPCPFALQALPPKVTCTDRIVLVPFSDPYHAGDLKPSLSKALNTILQPVRDHFESNAEAKELLKKVKSYKVTK